MNNSSLQKSGMSTNENTLNSFDSKNQFHVIDRSSDFIDYKDQQRRFTQQQNKKNPAAEQMRKYEQNLR